MSKSYDCNKCPGFCCSYPIIPITKRDVERLARHFELGFATAEKRFTRTDHGRKRVLRRKDDPHFGRVCRFFDTEARRCTVYEARPGTCRDYPNVNRCGYYDFLKFERNHQGDEAWIATTANGEWQ